MTRLRRWLEAAREASPFLLAATWFCGGYVPYEHLAERLARAWPAVRDDQERLTICSDHYTIFKSTTKEDT